MTDLTTDHGAVVTLPGDTTIQVVRRFAAPRRLVWRVWTEPDLIARWWHARRGEITGIEVDLRVGGAWRYAMRTPTGQDVVFYGECLELVPEQKLVTTEVFAPFPDSPARTTATFTDDGDGTLLTLFVEHTDRQARDMHVGSGMEDGLQDALDLVAGLAESLR